MNEAGRVAGGTCETCGQSWDWHQENKPIHPFNDGQAGATAFLGPSRNRTRRSDPKPSPETDERPQRTVWPSDPVLRVALLNRGIITTEDLRLAEQQLESAIGESISKGGSAWSAHEAGSTGSSTRTDRTSTAHSSEKESPSP